MFESHRIESKYIPSAQQPKTNILVLLSIFECTVVHDWICMTFRCNRKLFSRALSQMNPVFLKTVDALHWKYWRRQEKFNCQIRIVKKRNLRDCIQQQKKEQLNRIKIEFKSVYCAHSCLCFDMWINNYWLLQIPSDVTNIHFVSFSHSSQIVKTGNTYLKKRFYGLFYRILWVNWLIVAIEYWKSCLQWFHGQLKTIVNCPQNAIKW